MNYVKTIWALLPPVIAIIFALKTKEVYISLLIGVVSGTLLLTNFHLVESLNLLFDTVVNCLSKPSNIGILIFLVMLGIIVTLMTKSGGSQAYGKWAKKKMKSSKQSLFSTFFLGVVIFVDDYFNCLTVGSVMREITDEFKVSRAMLAYIIDSTAAPVCIIAPISSWAAAVSGYTSGDGFQLFLNTIPFNLYALLTIVMVCYVIGSEFHFGKMKKHELAAQNGDVCFGDYSYQTNEEISYNQKGKVLDLILPVIVLIMSCIIGMIYTGGFFDGKDLIIQSETGSGKTLSYLLPIFSMVDTSLRSTQFIILTPTHELAVQVHKQAEFLTDNTDGSVRSALIIGGANISRQIDKLKEKPQIVIGSTGRILDLIKKK